MFLPGRRSNTTSRAPSLYTRGSKEDLRFVPSAVAIPALGRRLDLDDDDDDDDDGNDEEGENQALRLLAAGDEDEDEQPLRMRERRPGMMPRTETFSSQRSGTGISVGGVRPESSLGTPTSERSSMFGADTAVQALRVSQIQKGTTAKDLASAFGLGQGPIGVEQLAITQIKVEWRPDGSALLHFVSGDEAMRAYFAYLGSNLSVGTVTPFDPDNAGSSSTSSSPRTAAILNSSPALAPPTQLNKIASASRLKGLGSWRTSTDKLQPIERNTVPTNSNTVGTNTTTNGVHSDATTSTTPGLISRVKTHKFRNPSRSSLSLGRRSTDILPLSSSTNEDANGRTGTQPPMPRHVSAPAQSPVTRATTVPNTPTTTTHPLSRSVIGSGAKSTTPGSNLDAAAPTGENLTLVDSRATNGGAGAGGQSIGRARRFMSSIGARFRSSDSLHATGGGGDRHR